MGQRVSWLTLQPKPLELTDISRPWWRALAKFLFIAGFGLPWILLSWLYVAYVIVVYLYWLAKDFGAPQSVREFRWKMRNMEMNFDSIIREGMKVTDTAPDKFEEVKAELVNGMQERGLSPQYLR
jgi:hypothetical protein